MADNYELHGIIIAYNANGNEVPLDKIRVSSFYNGLTKSAKTTENGDFKILFPKDKNSTPLEAGVKINLKIDDGQWTILFPRNGEIFIPKYANNEKIEIFVVANDSTLSLKGLTAKFKPEYVANLKLNNYYTVQVLSTDSKIRADLAKQEFELESYNQVNIKKRKSKYQVTVGVFDTWNKAQQHSDIIRNSFSRRYDDCFVKPGRK